MSNCIATFAVVATLIACCAHGAEVVKVHPESGLSTNANSYSYEYVLEEESDFVGISPRHSRKQSGTSCVSRVTMEVEGNPAEISFTSVADAFVFPEITETQVSTTASSEVSASDIASCLGVGDNQITSVVFSSPTLSFVVLEPEGEALTQTIIQTRLDSCALGVSITVGTASSGAVNLDPAVGESRENSFSSPSPSTSASVSATTTPSPSPTPSRDTTTGTTTMGMGMSSSTGHVSATMGTAHASATGPSTVGMSSTPMGMSMTMGESSSVVASESSTMGMSMSSMGMSSSTMGMSSSAMSKDDESESEEFEAALAHSKQDTTVVDVLLVDSCDNNAYMTSLAGYSSTLDLAQEQSAAYTILDVAPSDCTGLRASVLNACPATIPTNEQCQDIESLATCLGVADKQEPDNADTDVCDVDVDSASSLLEYFDDICVLE